MLCVCYIVRMATPSVQQMDLQACDGWKVPMWCHFSLQTKTTSPPYIIIFITGHSQNGPWPQQDNFIGRSSCSHGPRSRLRAGERNSTCTAQHSTHRQVVTLGQEKKNGDIGRGGGFKQYNTYTILLLYYILYIMILILIHIILEFLWLSIHHTRTYSSIPYSSKLYQLSLSQKPTFSLYCSVWHWAMP